MTKSENYGTIPGHYYMQRAIELAEKASLQGEVPVGALVVLDNQIIGEGWNQPITACDPTAHAEIMALRSAARHVGNYRLLDTTLYVTLEPCVMCMGAMLHARVKRLVFGACDPKVGAVQSISDLANAGKFNHCMQWTGGCEAEACGELLRAFFKARR